MKTLHEDAANKRCMKTLQTNDETMKTLQAGAAQKRCMRTLHGNAARKRYETKEGYQNAA